ncbi:MAG: SMP-30/gluconolactonase/LRE family protein [Pirellulales bacterium]|nr:SMP-30/gluconolactonase/LRE family protein [Pirellulales bacterium]
MLDKLFSGDTSPEMLGDGYGFAEGPAADAQGNVYFSDGQNDSIYVWRRGRPPELFVDDSTDANGMMFNAEGRLYVCEGAAHRVVAYDVKTKAKRVLCEEIDGRPFNEPNDLAVDRTGGFFFSDPNYAHRGRPATMKEDVYYCSASGHVSRVSTICRKPNGVLLSADGRTLYVADSRGGCVYRYDVTAPGRLDGERLWIEGLDANPDGMTLDVRNNLYVCCGAAGLRIFNPSARPLGQIDVHAANCCFGGRDFRTLCIASANRFLGIRAEATGMKPLPLRP